MKATGIVRRIDELGRIVIPKEIRKILRIKEGENLEIYVDNDENIVLKKFSSIKNIDEFAQMLLSSIYGFYKKTIIITDGDKVIAYVGNNKGKYMHNKLSDKVDEWLKKRKSFTLTNDTDIKIIDSLEENTELSFNVILSGGDVVGSIIILSTAIISDIDIMISGIISQFLTKHLEL